jgi:hypothetical protein
VSLAVVRGAILSRTGRLYQPTKNVRYRLAINKVNPELSIRFVVLITYIKDTRDHGVIDGVIRAWWGSPTKEHKGIIEGQLVSIEDPTGKQ